MMVYLPPVGMNHKIGGNIEMVCRKEGVNLIATQPILRGEALGVDYNSFGKAPQWYVDMLKECLGSDECVFPGFNDFVTG